MYVLQANFNCCLLTGIIQSFKAQYRKCLTRKQVLAIESGHMDTFLKKFSILDALYIVKRSWWLVTPQTIQNCFRKSAIPKEMVCEEVQCQDESDECDEDYFCKDFEDEENDCFGEINEEELLNEILCEDADDLQNELVEAHEKPKRDYVIKAFFILKEYLDVDEGNDSICKLEDILFRTHEKELVQKKIQDFFSVTS